jgi:hypothetical protein
LFVFDTYTKRAPADRLRVNCAFEFSGICREREG